MTRNSSFESPPSTRPLHREKRRVGEVAGGAAAECAAVCCCCPCSVMNLLILTVYKVPKGLCRKAWANTKKKRRCVAQKKGLLQPRPKGLAGGALFRDDMDANRDADNHGDEKKSDAESEGADLLEKEMWARFYGAGFLEKCFSERIMMNVVLWALMSFLRFGSKHCSMSSSSSSFLGVHRVIGDVVFVRRDIMLRERYDWVIDWPNLVCQCFVNE